MQTKLSSRERLTRVLRGQPLDRVPIHLWGVDPLETAERPGWQFLHDMINELELDTFFWWEGESFPPDVAITRDTRDMADPQWYEETTTYLTPAVRFRRSSR